MQCQEGFSGPASGPWGQTVAAHREIQPVAARARPACGAGGPVDLPNKKLAGLLAYLACTAPRPQQREKLSALLWGSHFDAQAKQNLRQALFRLRKIVGQDALQGDGDIVVLNAAAVACDVSRFEDLVREDTRESLTAAADLYRGRFMDDIAVSEEGWTEWLTGERQRLEDLALGALVRLGEQELAADLPLLPSRPPSAPSRSTTCAKTLIG